MNLRENEEGSDAVAVNGFLIALVLAGGLSAIGPISGLLTFVLLLVAAPLLFALPAALLFVLVYFGWLHPASTGRAQFTKLTWLCILVLVSLSIHWYSSLWSVGLRDQGRTYMVACSAGSAILLGGVLTAGIVGRSRNSVKLALFGRWLILVWVLTYGYPFLGQII
jgi:hypothetical protein